MYGDGATGTTMPGSAVGPAGAGELTSGGVLPAANCWARAAKSTYPVASRTLMWSSTVVLASSARARTREFWVLARTWATTENTLPCARRRMLANWRS